MKRKLYYLPLIAMFLLMLFTPMINQLVKVWSFPRKEENRIFHDSLHIDINLLDDFPNDFNLYVNDNFSFRTPLLDLFNYSKFRIFKTSPNPQKTIVGKDGWFFVSQKEIKIFEGLLNFSENDLILFEKEWIKRVDYLNKKGVKYYFLIAPIKHYIYPDKLPFGTFKNSKVKRSSALIKRLTNVIGDFIIDPTQELIQSNNTTYFKLDNHWNHRGGEIASKLTIKKISKDFPNDKISFPKVTWTQDTIQTGFHYDVVNVKDLKEIVEIPVNTKMHAKRIENLDLHPPAEFPYPNSYQIRYENMHCSNNLKILIIRDSFGGAMMPFLAECFSESLFIFDNWKIGLNEEIIEFYNPDLILFVNLETHLEHIIE